MLGDILHIFFNVNLPITMTKARAMAHDVLSTAMHTLQSTKLMMLSNSLGLLNFHREMFLISL